MDLDFDDQFLDQAAPAARAGARFKPKGRLVPKKKQTSQPTLPIAKEKLSTQEALTSETIKQSIPGVLSQENLDVISTGVNGYTKPSILRSCTKAVSEGEKCNEVAPAIHDDPPTQDSDAPATDGDIHSQTEEGECHVDMETLDIVQEEGTTSSFVQHTGKFQPKPRVLETVVDDNSYYAMGTNESELMVNVESRTTFYQVEEEVNIPESPREKAPEMDAQNGEVVLPSTNNTVEEEQAGRGYKKGKSKRAATRKRITTSEEEPNKSSENEEKNKFKHASRRQKKTSLDKELLETPDEEIRFLPFRDMLRLVQYKEAKGAPVVPPTQESNTNASDNQYHSQDFDGEDEIAMEEGENQETNVVKPESPVNYQTYMNKSSRGRWSKQDTQLFYEGLGDFGSNLSMVQQLFPNKTREQIKLKFKLEERRHPLKLNDALSSRSKNLFHFQNVIKKLQQEAAVAKQAQEDEDDQEQAGADVPDNEEPSKSKETEGAGVKESDGGDDGDDDDFWNSYKSDM